MKWLWYFLCSLQLKLILLSFCYILAKQQSLKNDTGSVIKYVAKIAGMQDSNNSRVEVRWTFNVNSFKNLHLFCLPSLNIYHP